MVCHKERAPEATVGSFSFLQPWLRNLHSTCFSYKETSLIWAFVASCVSPVRGSLGWRSFLGLLRPGSKNLLVCIPWLLSAALSLESKRCEFTAPIRGGFRHQTQSSRWLTVNTNLLPVNVVLITVLSLGWFLPEVFLSCWKFVNLVKPVSF